MNKGTLLAVLTASALALMIIASSECRAAYVDNLDGTVTDTATGLMWQKSDDGTGKKWREALIYCEELSLGDHDDWRLPNIRELTSVVDDARYGPSVDPALECRSYFYWSSSNDANDSGLAWRVFFYYGDVSAYSKTYYYYVRCVRGGL